MSMLRVKRKGYTRKGGVKVKPITYMIKDIGASGRGKSFISKSSVKKGILGKGFFEKSLLEQQQYLAVKAGQIGEKSVQGQLQYLANLYKRIHPIYSKRASMLRGWVAKHFQGKKYVCK